MKLIMHAIMLFLIVSCSQSLDFKLSDISHFKGDTKVLFLRDFNLYSIILNGKNEELINKNVTQLRWSPDGQSIVYFELEPEDENKYWFISENKKIFVYNLKTKVKKTNRSL